MSLMETLQEVTALRRQVDDQLRVVEGFRRSNREHVLLVRTELRGSRKSYDQQMLQALDAAETALARSAAALTQASEALSRVQSI
jgi:hypothetical protein